MKSSVRQSVARNRVVGETVFLHFALRFTRGLEDSEIKASGRNGARQFSVV